MEVLSEQPDILPGGKAAIVSNPLLGGVGVLVFETGEFRLLVERAGGGRYAPSGHLVFARSGTLLAVPFDLKELVVTGPESVILEGVRMDPAGPPVPQAVFSHDGTLVYAPGAFLPNAVRPVWVDRRGKVATPRNASWIVREFQPFSRRTAPRYRYRQS